MPMLVDFLNAALRSIGTTYVANDTKKIRQHLDEFNKLTDDELKERCRNALLGNEPLEIGGGNFVHTFLRLAQVFGRQFDKTLVTHLALAIASFSRAPADLPSGSSLYPEQMQAAVALTQHGLIQMDTGEGKTYALLPTAFALACRYSRVYIVCANEYLAWRDAHRTLPFWEYVGLTPGLCTESDTPDEQWLRRVVYTTLEAICFKSMDDDMGSQRPSTPLTFSAIILDEADAILLDRGDRNFALTVPVKSSAFDWTFAAEFAKQLQEGTDVVVDRAELSASLTVRGEEMLKDAMQTREHEVPYYLTRFAVENSYIALYVVEEDVHYVVESDFLYPIDSVTSKILRNQRRNWLPPLEIHKGIAPQSRPITIYERSPRQILKTFNHMSGLSGTIEDDSLEYLFSYMLPTLIIEPHFRKQKGRKDDLVLKTRRAAINTLVNEVLTVAEIGRPVLVGTQTIADTQDVYETLRPRAPNTTQLHSLTGKNEQEAASIFEQAGEVGSVIVATQLAGRGVDIRLSNEARSKGGLALFSLGHALEMRHDKQFLGRAGRQADPFTAQFVCSFEDRLLKEFGGGRMTKVIERIGLEEDVPIEASMVTSSITRAQRARRTRRIKQRLGQEFFARIEERTISAIKDWREYLQIRDQYTDPSECSSEFLSWTVDHFLKHTIQPLFHSKTLSRKEAENAERAINSELGLTDQSSPLLPHQELVARPPSVACQDIRNKILEELDRASSQRRKRLEETKNLRDVQHSALVKWRHVYFLTQAYYLMKEFNTDSSSKEAIEISENIGANFAESCAQELMVDDSTLSDGNPPFSRPDVIGIISGIRARLEDQPCPDEVLSQLQPIQSMLNREPSSYSEWDTVAADVNVIQKHIASVSEQLNSEIEQHEQELILLEQRTPRDIANQRLLLSWSDFLDKRDRIQFLVNREMHTELDRSQIVVDQVTEEWGKQEQNLTRQILQDLLHADQPELLNDLFFLVDNMRHDKSSETPSKLTWDLNIETVAQPEVRRREDEVVQQFIALHVNELNNKFCSGDLRYIVDKFLRQSPLTTLQTPAQILQALHKWSSDEVRAGVHQQRRNTNRIWLHKFLRHLHDNKVIGPLPNLGTRVKYNFIEFGKNMRNIPKALTALGALCFLLVFLIVSHFGDFADAKQFGPFGTRLDDLLFGGMLASGNIMAACFALPILVYMLADVLHFNKAMFLAGPIPLGFQILLALWLTPWRDSLGSLMLIQGIAIFIAIFLALQVSRSVISSLYTYAEVDLTLAWLCYTSLFVFVPRLWAGQAMPLQTLLVLAGVILFVYLWHHLNKQEILLSSERLLGEGSSILKSEQVVTSVNVPGSIGVRPHVFGVLCAWLTYELLTVLLNTTSTWVLIIVPTVIYLVVLIVWTNAILKKRFSFTLWQSRLNNQRQRLEEAPTNIEMKKYLQKSRKKLQRREILAQTVLLTSLLAALWGTTLAGTQFPLFVVLLFTAVLFASISENFFIQLSKFFLNRFTFQFEEVDLAKLFEPEQEDSSLIERIERALKNKTVKIFSAILVVGELLLNLSHLVDFMEHVVDWVWYLL